MTELKPVEGFPGYEVSYDGWVYFMGEIKQQTDTCNPLSYKNVILINGNKKLQISLHRLIAYFFIPNPENKPCVNHKDLDKMNCHADNLEWVTHSENTIHWHKEDKIYQEARMRKHFGNNLYEAIYKSHI